MVFLYNAGLRCYHLLLYIVALFHVKADKWVKGRKNWTSLLSEQRKAHESWMWFHCSSLGEYEDSCEVFNRLRTEYPCTKTLLTFFSPSGFEVLQPLHDYDMLLYLPLDSKRNAKKFLDILQPKVIFFSRSELWYNYSREIKRRNIPSFLLSLRLANDSKFLHPFMKSLYQTCFNTFTHIFCQDRVTQKNLAVHFNIHNTSLSGNPRFDRIYNATLHATKFPSVEKFIQDHYVIILGSSLPKDEQLLFKTMQQLIPLPVKYIIVPHEIDRKEIDATVKTNPQVICYSNIESLTPSHMILYIDFVGGLKHLYRYAHLALIGGGFDKIGIHNIVEPAAYGLKTLFGPHHKNYQEALDLLAMNKAFIYRNENELRHIIRQEMIQPADKNSTHEIIQYVKQHTGGCSKIMETLHSQFSTLI
ncbi:MAG TPA: glycosyltransferase N-terminal domain-containing protein [Cytophagaceae bacterium]|jgi:3-deoxy-D-manno-octulosonic-acid transferase|nr:glycosyltransferase N-terminal domain-containing protein [Cytophagaceae bacterium]